MAKDIVNKEDFLQELEVLKKLRLESEVSTKDIADKLGLSFNHYIMKESGKRISKKPEENEKFFYDVCHAIEELKKEYKVRTLDIEFNTIEESDKIKDLYHAPITKDIYKKILKRLKNKENLIVVCTDYLVNYEKVEDMLREDGLDEYTLAGKKNKYLTIEEALSNEDKVRSIFNIPSDINFLSVLV